MSSPILQLHTAAPSRSASTAPAAEGCCIGAPCSTLLHDIGAQETLTCLDPDGHRVQASYALRGSEALVALPAAARAGLQRIESDGKLRGCVAVNVDKRESEAAVLSAGQLQELAAKARRSAAVAQASDLRAVDEVREGRPLWPWALLPALGFLAAEQALVHKWKR